MPSRMAVTRGVLDAIPPEARIPTNHSERGIQTFLSGLELTVPVDTSQYVEGIPSLTRLKINGMIADIG